MLEADIVLTIHLLEYIDIITRVPGPVKYLTSLNTLRTCETKTNGRSPSLVVSMMAGVGLWQRFHHTLRTKY